ncbi:MULTISPECIES: hypothetical protein [unclassified Kitasatospora]|uniref:hypothetical protein n=1 Tax=unclassified Kitasatospora TaxID=2633591 RepID=UPI0033DFF0C8
MPPDSVLRTGPASTDLVLREGGGTRRSALVYCLASVGEALRAPLVLFAPTLLVAFGLWLFGAAGSTVAAVVGVIAGAEYLLAIPVMARMEVVAVHRVEFAPTEAADRFRLVRGGRPGGWRPPAELRAIWLVRSIVEPYPGDRAPAGEVLTVRLECVDEKLTWRPPAGTDPEQLHEALAALLGPAGVQVELVTKRSVRLKPSPTSSSPWISGGSGSANSGGFSGGG